jgi:hypothetical protein
MRVRAIQRMYYGRRMREPDETYEMDDREESEAKILVALGKIEILKEQIAKAAPAKIETRALKAEEPPAPTPAKVMSTETAPELTPRRYYRRRDLKAEE